MPKAGKYLLIGSTEPYSGKSATILGIAHQLQQKGLDIAYAKPVGTYFSVNEAEVREEDVWFIGQTLKLPPNRLRPTLVYPDAQILQKRLRGEDRTNYRQSLQQYELQASSEKLVLLEGAGTLNEGSLFDLSLAQIAETFDAPVLLVSRLHSLLVVDAVLSAKQQLGDRLLGVLINEVSADQQEVAETVLKPFLEQQGIPVFGLLPKSDLLRSVSVRELVSQLQAEVLCRGDRLDLMVETLKIGAMNVNSALEYFRQGRNMAVVTGGDRADIQLAALETSTQCLILTGHMPPQKFILSRAEDLEIPVLSVDLDTLTTVEIIDKTFGQVRLHEPIKVECIRHLMAKNFDIDRLMTNLGLESAVTV